jgi:DNA-binding NtrC family response regulator
LERNLSDTNDNNRSSILVVDDDPGIPTLIKQSLTKNGFKVSAFTDPIMALEDFKINCKTCGVILSDIRMQG